MNDEHKLEEHNPIAHLARLFTDDPLTDDDLAAFENSRTASEPDHADELIGAALRAGAFELMSDEARSLLLSVTDESESLEPQVRERLVDAAKRALQHRRHAVGPLPLLLFVTRREHSQPLEDIAAAIDVDGERLRAVESGSDDLLTLTPRQVADWIRIVGIGREQAETSLGRTFAESSTTARAAGQFRPRRAPKDIADTDAFIRGVLDELNRPSS